jgi:hypothetical protein
MSLYGSIMDLHPHFWNEVLAPEKASIVPE